MSADIASIRTADGRFAPGQSGNPAGRPPGARNRATLVAEGLLDDAAGDLTTKLIDEALAGDRPLLKVCATHLLGAPRGRPIELEIEPGRETDPVALVEGAMRALVNGTITPQEALAVARFANIAIRVRLGTEKLERARARSAADAPAKTTRSAAPAVSGVRKEVKEEAPAASPVIPLFSEAPAHVAPDAPPPPSLLPVSEPVFFDGAGAPARQFRPVPGLVPADPRLHYSGAA